MAPPWDPQAGQLGSQFGNKFIHGDAPIATNHAVEHSRLKEGPTTVSSKITQARLTARADTTPSDRMEEQQQLGSSGRAMDDNERLEEKWTRFTDLTAENQHDFR